MDTVIFELTNQITDLKQEVTTLKAEKSETDKRMNEHRFGFQFYLDAKAIGYTWNDALPIDTNMALYAQHLHQAYKDLLRKLES